MFSLSLVFTSLHVSQAPIQFSAFVFLRMLCAYVYDDIFKGTRQQTTNIITGSGRVPLLVVVVSPFPFIDARSTWIRLFSSSSQPRERWISVAEFIFICRLRWVRLGLNGAKKSLLLLLLLFVSQCSVGLQVQFIAVMSADNTQHTTTSTLCIHNMQEKEVENFSQKFLTLDDTIIARRFTCATLFFTCLKWNFSFKKIILLFAFPPLAGKKGGVLLGMHEIFLRRAV